MHIAEGISIGISAIRSNKLRSLLTIIKASTLPPIEALRKD